MPALSILVIEDEPLLARYLCDALIGFGHCVRLASSLAAAQATAHSERFDLILVDRRLPDGDGSGLYARLRNDPSAASQHTPLILMSADVAPGFQQQLLDAGFRAVWQKPVSLATLGALGHWGGAAAAPAAAPAPNPAAALLDLDDAAALERLGTPEIVVKLRQLLRGELARHWQQIGADIDAGRHRAAREEVHRQRAACALCGAPRAAAAFAALEKAFDEGLDLVAPRSQAGLAVEALMAQLLARAPG